MWQRFTTKARSAIFVAMNEARAEGVTRVATEHLLIAIAKQIDSAAIRTLQAMEVSPQDLVEQMRYSSPLPAAVDGRDMVLSPRAKRVVDFAFSEARGLSDVYIGTEHLLLGIIREGDGIAGRTLSKFGVNYQAAMQAVASLDVDRRARET